MPGGGVSERSGRRVVDREQRGHEVSLELAGHHRAGDLESLPRLEAGLEVRPKGVAGERGTSERIAAVAGDIADQNRRLAAPQGQHVVEVAAGTGSVGWTVCHGR